MAAFRKRSNGWQARIRRKGFSEVNKSFATLKEAESWARNIESEMDRGVFVSRVEADNTTLAELLTRYLKEITPQKKHPSIETYRIKAWLKTSLAKRFISTIRSSDFAFRRDARIKDGMSPASIKLEFAIISHLYFVARAEWGFDGLENPIRYLRMPKLHGKQCTFARSYPLGSVRLTSQLQSRSDGVIDEQHQSNFQLIIRSQLKDAMLNEAAKDSLIVGAGGAFTAIALYLEALGEAPVAGRLPALRIRELKDRMCKLTSEERKQLKGIPPDRLDIMPAALLTICVLADLTQAEAFYLTHHGVRQGMIQLLMAEDVMHS